MVIHGWMALPEKRHILRTIRSTKPKWRTIIFFVIGLTLTKLYAWLVWMNCRNVIGSLSGKRALLWTLFRIWRSDLFPSCSLRRTTTQALDSLPKNEIYHEMPACIECSSPYCCPMAVFGSSVPLLAWKHRLGSCRLLQWHGRICTALHSTSMFYR